MGDVDCGSGAIATRLVRVLPGERLNCLDPDDIQHWLRVYTELCAFAERLLASYRGDAADGSDAAGEFLRDEARAVENEWLRLRARLAYWCRRVEEIGASHGLP
jgi:hypothetical protein